MHTNQKTARLAPDQTRHREAVDPRILFRRLHVAFMALVADADRRPEPRHKWDDAARADRRGALPFEREREMIHGAIQQGATNVQRVLDYHLARIADDLAQFGQGLDAGQVLYTRLANEEAEAVAAQTLAHALNTPQTRDDALRITREAITMEQLYCATIALPSHPITMGVPR